VPPDRELIRIYANAALRLRALVKQSIDAERLGTAAYYRRQHEQVRAVLRDLGRKTRPLAWAAILQSYLEGLRIARIVERADLPPATLGARFNSVHRVAVEAAVDALVGRLDAARETVGRSTDDVFRRLTLETVATTIATGEGPRGQARALRADLEKQGLTAFVDKRGARWSLENYSSMATITVTREASTVGTVREMGANDRDLIAMTKHSGSCDVCRPWEGRTYSLSGRDPRYPKATVLAPLHPRCAHSMYPATATLEDLERELGIV